MVVWYLPIHENCPLVSMYILKHVQTCMLHAALLYLELYMQ
jgi:hypothetical protein